MVVVVHHVQRQGLELSIVRGEALDCLDTLWRRPCRRGGGQRGGGARGLALGEGGGGSMSVIVGREGEFAHENVSRVDGVCAEAAVGMCGS